MINLENYMFLQDNKMLEMIFMELTKLNLLMIQLQKMLMHVSKNVISKNVKMNAMMFYTDEICKNTEIFKS